MERAMWSEAKPVAAWTKIISVVLDYQNNHRNLSPTDEMIAVRTGLSRDVVRSQLRAMEEAGLISDSKRWPRLLKVNKDLAIDQIMGVIDPKQSPPLKLVENKEEEKMDTQTNTKRRYKKRDPFLVAAKKLAQALVDYHDLHGHAPYLKELAVALGYDANNSGGVSRVLGLMKKQGWVHHGHRRHHDVMLTSLGRAMLFGVNEELHTDMPVHPVSGNKTVYAQPPQPRMPHVEVRRASEPAPMVRAGERTYEVEPRRMSMKPLHVETPRPSGIDAEIEAMRTISQCLEPLAKEERRRVLTWVRDRLSL